jgi:hypothetical protein
MNFRLFVPIAAAYLFFLASCNANSKEGEMSAVQKAIIEATNPDFKPVNGIRFFEVKRRFRNGLSFNKDGFQHVPTWVVEFKAPDTMLAYSPEKKGMESFYLQYDHGKVYNFAREYFRAIKVTKDSLILQRLQVDGKVIAGNDDVRSDVYCTFYTKSYIDRLKTTIGELQKPTHADTLFIQQLAAKTNRDPSSPVLAFAATTPVVIEPKSALVKAEKISTADPNDHRSLAYDYIYPQYNLEISRAYKAFNYSFSVIVDSNGKLYVNRVDGVMPEDVPPRKRLLEGITKVYLQNLFKITPGKTLGIAHSSEITIYLVGKLAK